LPHGLRATVRKRCAFTDQSSGSGMRLDAETGDQSGVTAEGITLAQQLHWIQRERVRAGLILNPAHVGYMNLERR
jgi:hypothetical protein